MFRSSPLTQIILPSIKGKIGELTLHTLAFYENQLPELDFRSIGSLVLNGQSIFKAESDQTNILNVYFPEQIRTPNSEWYWFLIRGGKKVNAYTPNNVSKSQLINMLALNDSEFNKYFEHLTY